MAKMVGFAYAVKLSWLKQAVELKKEMFSEKEYKSALNEYLAFEIGSPTRLRKVREILMHIWYYDCDFVKERERALQLLEDNPDDAVALHYCMICLAYPVFFDICSYMGQMLRFRDDITTAVLKQKLYDEWGERSTLEPTSQRVTLMLRELGLLKAAARTRYVPHKINLVSDDTTEFLLEVMMRIGGSGYYSISELGELPILFPFGYCVKKEKLMQSKHLSLSSIGGQLSVSPNK